MDFVKAYPDRVPDTEIGYRFMGLGAFVAERDPERIALNYAEKLSLAEGSETFTLSLTDGVSYADHLQLSNELGPEYAARLVSAEYMILDYLNTSVMAEIVVYGGSGRPREIRGTRSDLSRRNDLERRGRGLVRDPGGRSCGRRDDGLPASTGRRVSDRTDSLLSAPGGRDRTAARVPAQLGTT